MTQHTSTPQNDEHLMRVKKMHDLAEAGINPYPSDASRTHTAKEALAMTEGESATIAGRIMLKREIGKLTFCTVRDDSGDIQVCLKQDEIGKESYTLFVKKIDVGDIIEASGERFQTKKGEESLMVSSWRLLAKALRPLPDKFHGIQDEEVRLRKRYLDLLLNPELRDMFRRKAIFWNSMRDFLLREGFLEVETPVLEVTPGGADARPFETHHNALDIDVTLRISCGELWQKRLMVAGFEKVFEIGRIFRNEGMSPEHAQDYTQMEFYWAYADYKKGMELVERMYKEVIKKTFGTLQFESKGFRIDFEKPWETYDFQTLIKEKTGIDVLHADLDAIEATLKKLKITYDKKGFNLTRGVDNLWKYCRKGIAGPGFLINVPVFMEPLAKRSEKNPDVVERYQIIIAGSENGKGFSELNDPIDQAERFQGQQALRDSGDEEAQAYDHDYVEALEYGMPPTTGFGVSERLFAFLENKPIRECALFPLLKSESQEAANKKTMAAHAVILDTPHIPAWSKLNAAAHLSASLAARLGKQLIEIDHSITKDGEEIPMNIRHAIMMKRTEDRGALLQLKHKAEEVGLEVTCFTEEMRDSKNDVQVKQIQEKKKASEIGFLGVLIYGEMKQVEQLTKDFSLYE